MGVIVGLNSRWSRENYERNKQAEVIQICEIKDCLKVLDNPESYTMATMCMAEDELQSYGAEWLNHLISLLEEKDKALAFYADNDNWENGHAKYNDEGDKVGNESYVEEDGGDIARAALTSSNNEGD